MTLSLIEHYNIILDIVDHKGFTIKVMLLSH